MFGLVSERRYENLEKEHEALKTKIKVAEQLSVVNSALGQEVATLQGQLAKVKKSLREQTEADLFFISAKIQKKLLDGEPKENIQELTLQRLYQDQLARQQTHSSPFPLSLLGGLGLGGLGSRR